MDKAPHSSYCLFLIFRAVLKRQTSKIIEDSKASRLWSIEDSKASRLWSIEDSKASRLWSKE
jgi:hypothetical protein